MRTGTDDRIRASEGSMNTLRLFAVLTIALLISEKKLGVFLPADQSARAVRTGFDRLRCDRDRVPDGRTFDWGASGRRHKSDRAPAHRRGVQRQRPRCHIIDQYGNPAGSER